jgi:multidrug efflux pump
VIGVIQYEFVDWRERKPANAILADLRQAMVGIPGVDIQVRSRRPGRPPARRSRSSFPPTTRPI